MHYSAKHGLAVACRPSVRPSVRLFVRLIARTVSPASLIFVAQRPSTYSQGTWGNFVRDYRWGRVWYRCGKVVCCCTKAAISLKRVKIE